VRDGAFHIILGRRTGIWREALVLALSLLCACGTSLLGAGSPMRDYGLKDYVRLSEKLPHSEDRPWRLVCGLPHNAHFQPWIEVRSEAGREIRFNSSNPLVLYLTDTETWSTGTNGLQSREASQWVSGEGAIYTVPAGVTVTAVKYRETGFDTNFAGSFACNDEDYNILWKKAARTAYVCMRDHFYDCPDRERVGFWGDGTPELGQCFYVFDSRSHELCRNLVRRRLEPDFYPGQHLEFLGDYGLWFYYLQTGDLDSMKAVYEPTREFLFDTYKFGKHGTWFDWGKENKDTAVIETCFYYNCLEVLGRLAPLTGHPGDVLPIRRKLEEIRSSFDSRFWRGGFYQSSQVAVPDDRANAMAVLTGLADSSKWPAIHDNVLSKREFASCFFDRWVFEALCRMGHEKQALLRMGRRYRTMIPCSFTTLWEHYDRWWASQIDAFDEGSSLNHGWNPPALLLSQTVAGVSPVEPGWSTFSVLPKEAFLTHLHAVVPSIKGPITVEIRKTATEYSLTLESPANTTAIVGIPRRAFSRLDTISANGKPVWDHAFHGIQNGVEPAGEDDGYVRFKVPPGTWTFVGRGTIPSDSTKVPTAPTEPDIQLDHGGWTTAASVPDGLFAFSGAKLPIDVGAANAVDGDHWTGWRDLTSLQHPGQWFQIDLARRQSFNKVVLDNTWALWDSPVGYAVTVSDDGVAWSAPVASGAGQPGITTIRFPRQTARFVRITQTGSSPTYHWSIYEFDVCLGN